MVIRPRYPLGRGDGGQTGFASQPSVSPNGVGHLAISLTHEMSTMSLRTELPLFGYSGGAERFNETITDIHREMYRNWNDEDLQRHPREATLYCDAVRRSTRCPDLPDAFILGALTNI